MKAKVSKKAPKKSTTKKAAPKKTAAPKKKTAPKKAAAPKKSTIKKAAPKKTAAPKKKAAPKKVATPGKKAAKKVVNRAKRVERNKKVVTTVITTITTTTSITPKETHYLLIVDESGSMESARTETLGGLNEQIQTIKNLNAKYPEQKYFVSIIKFDNEIVPLFENVPADKLKKLTLEDYNPDATTALHDAIGISVRNLKNKISSKLDSGEADAYVVILTDGFENASREYNKASIKALIETLEATKMWTFTYIGANQNAVATSAGLGISYQNTSNYVASGVGSTLAFNSLSSSLGKRAMYRSAGVFTNDSYLSEVACNNNIGEDATKLDLSGTVSADDIQKAKDALAKAINTSTNSTTTGNNTNSTPTV